MRIIDNEWKQQKATKKYTYMCGESQNVFQGFSFSLQIIYFLTHFVTKISLSMMLSSASSLSA